MFGSSYNDNLIKIDTKKDNIHITGYIGNLSLIKKRRGEQYIFINGRYITNRLIDITLLSAYKYLIERKELVLQI